MNIKKKLILLNWILTTQFGIDISLFVKGIIRLPNFFFNLYKFYRLKDNNTKIVLQPCLHDKYDNSGEANSEYFIQDLLVSQLIYKNKPLRHIDLGSRIDGFVSQVASFREIEILDIRPLNTKINNVTFRQIDIMDNESIMFDNATDSLSCLHTIEHFGLGRYGDKLDKLGYERGVSNLIKILKNNGILYLSTPIGKERIYYNANWVFNPNTLLNLFQLNNIKLIDFYYIKDGNTVNFPNLSEKNIIDIIENEYGLGIFILKKEIL